jgi:hypothetical protein
MNQQPVTSMMIFQPMLIIRDKDNNQIYIDLHTDVESAQTLDLIKLLFLLGVYKTRSTPMGATINLTGANIPRVKHK